MNIAVKGSTERVEELSGVLSSAGLTFSRVESTKNIHSGNFDVIFDLNFDDDRSSLSDYLLLNGHVLLLLSSVKVQLEAVLPRSLWEQSAGINAIPTFLGRKTLEYCTPGTGNLFTPEKLNALGWSSSERCASRVGLVSPRIVFMIINEAYFTLQEGTAGREDINKGMKLGTAYPFGPFEWCEKAGLKNVYETLSALYDDTHDDRYKICSLMKTEYLQSLSA